MYKQEHLKWTQIYQINIDFLQQSKLLRNKL